MIMNKHDEGMMGSKFNGATSDGWSNSPDWDI